MRETIVNPSFVDKIIERINKQQTINTLERKQIQLCLISCLNKLKINNTEITHLA